jgi:hypothetical protein
MQNLGLLAVVGVLALACGKSGATEGPNGPSKPGDGPTGLPSVPGEPDTSVQSALPPVPSILGVRSKTVGDSVDIQFEPVAGARDYRVYVLPPDSDVTAGENGAVTVANATYRCAGDRQARTVTMDDQDFRQSESVKTVVEGDTDVLGYKRKLDDATLGYVYVTPGAGRIPVYAMGDPAGDGDNDCYHQRWSETRVKKYVVSEDERSMLLAQRWRDDGIAFYVPSDGARAVLTKPKDSLYFVAGPEADHRGSADTAFSILDASAGADTVPLMRVFYLNGCGRSHDELVAGQPRFERARKQGSEQPMFNLHWSGITEETTLVVEALDTGCPFQGVLAPVAKEAGNEDTIDYPPFFTIEDIRAKAEHGEVFINGQHEEANRPRPIARTFLKVKPGPKPEMDWFAGFGPDETLPDLMAGGWDYPCGIDNCFKEYRQVFDFADLSFNSTTPNRIGVGVVHGELWVTYADVGADVGGKFRLSPTTKGEMVDDSYLHVTMEVDNTTTSRRYPQLIVSSGELPVQFTFPTSNALIVQTFPEGSANWPFFGEIQVCENVNWNVNNQCPSARMHKILDGNKVVARPPIPEASELSGVDQPTRFDAFFSVKRAYLFLNDQPYGCVDLPERGVPKGPVNITFGDVLYHSGVDEVMAFQEKHQKIIAKRHFDNLGFKSKTPAPAWDEARLPCFAPTTFKSR